jgi:hypothetical protein
MTKLAELIARWDTDEGKPYKGGLIDWDAYQSDADNIGCMCAQGQVLHLVAGWTPDRLRDVAQEEADAETAKLLNISRAHAVLLRTINDKTDGAPAIVLTDPGKVIGDQWSKLLDFWWHIDGMTGHQWTAAGDEARAAAGDAARAAAGDAAWTAAWTAARDAAGDEARAAAGDAARAAARDAAWTAAGASREIQGAAILKEKGRPLFFLPAFGFSSPDDIPPRPANYGVQA